MERLIERVAGRTVALLLHGSSVGGLADRTAELAAAGGVVWAGLNHFRLLEARLLTPASRTMDLVFCCADGEVERRLEDLGDLLSRPDRPLLITRPAALAAHAELSAHRAQVLTEPLPALWPYPNSLILFLRLLVVARPARIVLCGADGYLGEDDAALPTYFGSEQFQREGRLSGVLRDTLLFNAHFPALLARWQVRLGAPFPEILNASPGTVLRGLPVIGHDQLGAALGGAAVRRAPAPPAVMTRPLPRGHARDPRPELHACARCARRGDLRLARQYALRALDLAPEFLTPLAFRALQTDATTVGLALEILARHGAERPASPHHWRWSELQGELIRARAATLRWENWCD
jgi:hypothetical protein